ELRPVFGDRTDQENDLAPIGFPSTARKPQLPQVGLCSVREGSFGRSSSSIKTKSIRGLNDIFFFLHAWLDKKRSAGLGFDCLRCRAHSGDHIRGVVWSGFGA